MRVIQTMAPLCALLGMALGDSGVLHGADVKAISPPGAKVAGPYTPGLLVGGFLYVSGQGARDSRGEIPPTTSAQVRQTLDNIRSIVESVGLTMEHVVYAHLYVTDLAAYEPALAAWSDYFGGGGPALAVLGMSQLPGTPVEISAVAVADLALKRAVRLPGTNRARVPPDAVVAGNRLFFSSCLGVDEDGRLPADSAAQTHRALDRVVTVLEAAGITLNHTVFVNIYHTDLLDSGEMNRVYAEHFKFGDAPANATVSLAHLPYAANVAFSGVAVMNVASRRPVRPRNMSPSATANPCMFAGDTLYCSAKSAYLPGPNQGIYAESLENQVRQTMRNLIDGLEEAGMDLSSVVATNVYLDDVLDFARMNAVYATYFETPFPTRTTVQPHTPAPRKMNEREQWPALEQISLIAVR